MVRRWRSPPGGGMRSPTTVSRPSVLAATSASVAPQRPHRSSSVARGSVPEFGGSCRATGEAVLRHDPDGPAQVVRKPGHRASTPPPMRTDRRRCRRTRDEPGGGRLAGAGRPAATPAPPSAPARSRGRCRGHDLAGTWSSSTATSSKQAAHRSGGRVETNRTPRSQRPTAAPTAERRVGRLLYQSSTSGPRTPLSSPAQPLDVDPGCGQHGEGA